MSYEAILVEKIDSVCRITLNQPKKLNALSTIMMDELLQVTAEVAEDPSVRCVILTGAGRGFSSGADLSDPSTMPKPGQPIDLGAALEKRYNPLLERIRAMQKPVVAAINGMAAGAGCNIALACDIILCADDAKFLQAFVNIALVPDAGGTWTIPRLIGRARAMQWMMTGEIIDADTASNWGLVNAVYPADALADEAMALAQRLAAGPTATIGRIKSLLDAAENNTLTEQLHAERVEQKDCGMSPNFMEGVSAFMQKRPANFSAD